MIAYKLVRKMKNGSLSPLFINKRMRYVLGHWHQAEDIPTEGFAHRPGFHCTVRPIAPHLKKEGRVWLECQIRDYVFFTRPESQGGRWVLAQWIKPIREL